MIPICLTSHNRAKTLRRSLASLGRTEWPADAEAHLIVYDDSSTEPEAIGLLERLPTMHGLASQEVIYNWPPDFRLGPHWNTALAIQQLFLRYPQAPGVVAIENDLVYHPAWFSELVYLVELGKANPNPPIGVATAYDSALHAREFQNAYPGEPGRHSIVKRHTGGGHACYYTRAFWMGCRVFDAMVLGFRGYPWKRRTWDWWPGAVAKEEGLYYAALSPGFVQHIGQDGHNCSPRANEEVARTFIGEVYAWRRRDAAVLGSGQAGAAAGDPPHAPATDADAGGQPDPVG